MFKNLSPSALGISGHQSEIIESTLTFGFQGLDLNLAETAARARLHGVDYARRLFASAKLRLGCFPLGLDWDADDATFAKGLAKLGESIQVAADVGCTRCVATVSAASDQRPYHENFEFFRRRIAEVCGVLAPAGIQLGVGFQAAEYLRKGRNFQFIHELDALTLLLKMVAASNVGLLLDVWDVYVGGGSVATIRKLPVDQLVAVQVANLPAGVPASELNENSRLLPGDESGSIDIPAVLLALSEMGYRGPVTPAPSKSVFKNPRREVIVREAGESLSKVWKAAGLSTSGRPVAATR